MKYLFIDFEGISEENLTEKFLSMISQLLLRCTQLVYLKISFDGYNSENTANFSKNCWRYLQLFILKIFILNYLEIESRGGTELSDEDEVIGLFEEIILKLDSIQGLNNEIKNIKSSNSLSELIQHAEGLVRSRGKIYQEYIKCLEQKIQTLEDK